MKLFLRRRKVIDWESTPAPGGAVFSIDRRHRLFFWRRWDIGPLMIFIMLNPSTAGAREDDPTSKKCAGFAKRHGFGGVAIVNLFTLCATDPADLLRHIHGFPGNPNSTDGDRHLQWVIDQVLDEDAFGVAAWGAEVSGIAHRAPFYSKLLGIPLQCLKVTKYGHPGHPLYIPYSAEFKQYDPQMTLEVPFYTDDNTYRKVLPWKTPIQDQ